jgi:hypothetical protein
MANYGKNFPYGKSYYKDYPQILTKIEVIPGSASVKNYGTLQFTAYAKDQSGQDYKPEPVFVWSVSGGGTITQTGLFTAENTGNGSFVVTASYGGVSGTAVIDVFDAPKNVCNDGSTLPNTVVLDIIKRALRLLQAIEAGETPSAKQAADFLQILNWMVDEWSNDRLLVYQILNETFTLVAGQQTYKIGPDSQDCDFFTSNPIRITGGFVRDITPGYNNDWKLEIIPNDRYQEIFQKAVQSSYPRYIHFVHSWPYGTIDLWPVPNKAYIIELSQWKQLKKFTGMQDIVCLPPGYKDALALGLAEKMAPEFGKDSSQISMLLLKAKHDIQINNYEPRQLDCDSALMNRRGYNIYSDRNW